MFWLRTRNAELRARVLDSGRRRFGRYIKGASDRRCLDAYCASLDPRARGPLRFVS